MKSQTLKFLLFLTLSGSSLLLNGCGARGGKVIKEAGETVGKKISSEAESVIGKEAGQTEKKAAQETEEYYSRRSSRPRHNHNSTEYEEYLNEAQTYTVQCPNCRGAGVVYYTDYYGNIQYDFYGNPVTIQCGQCGGYGAVTITE